MTSAPLPCSNAARERRDPMLGTAPPQARFLLVEQDGGWGSGGSPVPDVPEDVREELVARAAAADARLMLIRRPGRQSSSICLMRAWCVVDPAAPEGERVTWGTWAYPTELLAAADRLEELVALATDQSGDRCGGPGDDVPLVLVCTHGRKDPCCAVRGRPVAAALSGRWPEQTWECSHTGGDRFAANVLLLPDGATYGGLDVDTALAAVEAHLEGRPDVAHLRGATGRPRPVQAAVVAVHEQLGPLPWGSVRPVSTSTLEPTDHDAAATTVTLALVDGRRVEVDVREHLRDAAALTCRADAAGVSQVPVPGEVRILP